MDDVLRDQRPVAPRVDLRDMLRSYLVRRSLEAMEHAGTRRREAGSPRGVASYREAITCAVRGFYGELPAGEGCKPPQAKVVSRFECDGYAIENITLSSFPGWEVNASVYVPLEGAGRYPGIVVPVGHSGKQFESYQLPCQVFARSGYVAVVFDPPGQAGEKQQGNDHFVDGVRYYPVGQTSSCHFVADALRCVDYLYTREDVDTTRGVAMTGVSGGGTTTTLAGLLDARITVMGPSCCLAPLADLDITQCYCGCPETHMWRRYAEGVDEVDLLCAAAPRAVLLMAGRLDEVFRIEDTRRLAGEVQAFFESAGAKERFQFFEDDHGHGYSVRQAQLFVDFLEQWLKPESSRRRGRCEVVPEGMHPAVMLSCEPRQDVHMRSLAAGMALQLRERRKGDAESIRPAMRRLFHADDTGAVPDAEVHSPFRLWTHRWQSLLLRPEPGIELPGTLLLPQEESRYSLLLHFDDGGRHRLLERNGVLAQAVRLLDRKHAVHGLLTIDLRGWGDTAPAIYPYELASWGGVDRYLAYTSAALGDGVMGMRVRDGLAALAYLQSSPGVAARQVVLSGSGLGGMVALHVAALAGETGGLVIWDAPLSLEELVSAEHYCWPADLFMPEALRFYDFPDLLRVLDGPACWLSPLDATGRVLCREACDAFAARHGFNPAILVEGTERVVDILRQFLEGAGHAGGSQFVKPEPRDQDEGNG